MVDRRVFFIGAILLALGALSLIGLTPMVLWQKAQEFAQNATGAAQTTRAQSDRRQNSNKQVGDILDDLPGAEKKPAPRQKHP